MTVFDDIGRGLISFWMLAAGPIEAADVRAAVGAFGFFSGFLIYILTSIASRKAYVRIQRKVTVVITVQGFSLFLGIMDLATQASFLGWSNFLFKSSLITWTVSLIPLYYLLDQVVSIDRIKFKKPTEPRLRAPWRRSATTWPPFSMFQDLKATPRSTKQFGVGCVDHYLKLATKGGHRLFFPILVVAEKHFRPWRICLRFAAAGLSDDERVIYFSFNQPPDIIVSQLAAQFAFLKGSDSDWRSWWRKKENEDSMHKFENLYIVDCCSPWIGSRASHASQKPSEEEQKSPEKKLLIVVQSNRHIFRSDPRDPVALGSKYEKALRKVIHDSASPPSQSGKPVSQSVFVRVVYDSISDLLQYGDPQLTMQLIKHNMVWEDQNRANSLYLYIRDVPRPGLSMPVDIGFLRWNAYCEVDFEYQKTHEYMSIESLFSEKKGPVMIKEMNNDWVLKSEEQSEEPSLSVE